MPGLQQRNKSGKQNERWTSRWPHNKTFAAEVLSYLFLAFASGFLLRLFPPFAADLLSHFFPAFAADFLSRLFPAYPQSLERCHFCLCMLEDIWGRPIGPNPQDIDFVFNHWRSGVWNEAVTGSFYPFYLNHPGQLFGRFPQVGQFENVRIAPGTLAELEARRQCAFCDIVLCTVRADAAVNRSNEWPVSKDHPMTIHVREHQASSISLSFDTGPETCIAVKKVLPTHSKSIAKVDQVVGASIHWEQIRRWIDLCITEHTGCRSTVTTPSGMRLIDVRDRKVTPELSPHHPRDYFALSYVWGKNIDRMKCVLLKENTTQLEQTNGLESLPKTIEDAMTICKNLGQRFLWVDRLCITQDDEAKRGHQIHAMGDIFRSAVLTIVAACGNSMESPIPGISTERQTFQSQTHIAGFQVTSALPRLSRTLHGASWSRRGWTYQEGILSSRKLYFTDLEIWFTCNDGFQREDDSLEESDRSNIRSQDIPMTQLQSRFFIPEITSVVMMDYWRHLNGYTKRSLTYRSDIYNAFTGVLTALFGEDKTVYGLPKLFFDEALLWTLAGGTPSRAIPDCTAIKQRIICPSWAWSSINVAAEIGGGNVLGRYLVSLVPWSLVDEKGNAKTIDVKFEKFDIFSLDCTIISLMFAWRGGCFEAPLPSDLQKKLELDEVHLVQWARGRFPQRWPTQKEFWNEVRPQGSPGTQVPSTIFNHLQPGMLLTRTQTTVLRLGTCRKKKS